MHTPNGTGGNNRRRWAFLGSGEGKDVDLVGYLASGGARFNIAT